jgi:ribosomal protein L12E/L44/L45/RPP1/RPP2
MAKKTRKVMKQQSQQRAIQQAVANVSTVDAAVAPAPAAPTPAAPARAAKLEIEEQQEFTYVKSDVRRSLTLAGIFIVAMVVLSFIVR